MGAINKSERETQDRVVRFFIDRLGYTYLGNWEERDGNSNIEEALLEKFLKKTGHAPEKISRAIYLLRQEADNRRENLYTANKEIYKKLRYGVDVKLTAAEQTDTIQVIKWDKPEENDFYLAEEVTLRGNYERRPDVVLYINGIAIGVLELKNSRVSLSEGIRQNLSNQEPEFNEWFFRTVQFVFAGNDSEGLRYGTIKTEEKYFLAWKEDEEDNTGYKLDKYLGKICNKARLIELMHNFVLFDGGVKKLPRVHQYMGIRKAQEQVRQRKGGIIWHTQGSGKSIVMVLLARWILENNPHARIAVITDRDELDDQIEGVFSDAGEPIYRTSSGQDLMRQLSQPSPRLLCSLVHKFGVRGVDDFEAFIAELQNSPSQVASELFVFVDECHRTQSGKLHRVMKAMLQDAVFIGFTGTPLLKKDKQTTMEVFGHYIDTYKFSEAVEDGIVLDLVYEARDIDQTLGSPDKIDAWFEAKTKGLNNWQKEELKAQWGTMQRVLSSASRMDRVVSDIIFDFSTKPRLSDGRGNAFLVASSIYEACKYFRLFEKTPFKGKCAIVTSYNPQARDISKEDTGANSDTDKKVIFDTYQELLQEVSPRPGLTKTETYEETAKKLFIEQPANMKLLIVVDKLLTGFDAPPCTYLYIDKSMQDHGLFQAICRTNRLDGEDKDFGYIVDYKNLFKKVEKAVSVYSSELDTSAPGGSPAVLLEDRVEKARKKLEEALETIFLLCEPVAEPKADLDFIHYFCGNTEIASDLEEREQHRAALYKSTAALVRAYANLANEMDTAKFTKEEALAIKAKVEHAVKVRDIVRLASGERLDLKAYEADMRHLIDTYIEAKEPRKISPFDDIGLLELIVKSGIADAIAQKLSRIKENTSAVAETIENNVRSKIIQEHLNNPAYYEKMSVLLDELIKFRKQSADKYAEYLKRIALLAKQVDQGRSDDTPKELDTPGKRALYDNLGNNVRNALAIHEAVLSARFANWRGNQAKEQAVKRAIASVLSDDDEIERVFHIVKAQREF